MPALPNDISNRMVALYDHVDNAIKQLEAFASQFGVALYRDGTANYEYVHDFTLMLAVDDLESITLALSDGHGTAHVEHVVNMRINDNRAKSPLLELFKTTVGAGEGQSTLRENLPPLTNGSFSYVSQGKGIIDQYRRFFAVKWTSVQTEGSQAPVITTKSDCDDFVPEQQANQPQLSDERLALPSAADTAASDEILALPNYSDSK